MNSLNPTPAAATSMESDTPEADDNCPICRDSFYGREVKPEIVKTQCGHRYDEGCITQWLNRQGLGSYSCAICRQPPLPLQRESGARFYEQSPFCEVKPMQICRNGDDLDALQEMLKNEPSIARYEFRSGWSGIKNRLLFMAAQFGHTGHAQALIAAGAYLNATAAYGVTSLCIASARGHAEIVKELIKAGADVDIFETLTQTTPLFRAAKSGHVDIVKELIKAGAKTNIARNDGMTPLGIAAANGHTDCVEALKPLNTHEFYAVV